MSINKKVFSVFFLMTTSFASVAQDWIPGDTLNTQGGASAHLNIIWSPVKQVNGGIEYTIARRTNKDNQSGVADRIQIMIKYFF